MMKKNDYISINNWPKDDRPREKLLKYGEHTLNNSELLAILLRSGVKGQSALDLARAILKKFKTLRDLSHTDSCDWKEFKGLGNAKIAQIKAAVEIGRRFIEEETKETKPKITSSKDIAKIFIPRMRDLKKEIFKVLFLTSKNQIIDILEMAEGTVNQANPIIRDIFQKALQNFAVSIICAHNHPSGDPTPSTEDKEFTQQLTAAGKTLQIQMLDHIIIGNNTYFSFADKGLI
ncbi:MAG: DNA repair protein RadC [Candidatus Omnitrophota bacterium]|nr:DNA repair protein RadC [Candidatus Omnitrophota bacterium]